MGDFEICLTFYLIVHKQLENGFAIIMVFNDKVIYQYLKLINVMNNSK
jgi:hypothetical protein